MSNTRYMIWDNRLKSWEIAESISWSLAPRTNVFSDQYISLDQSVRYYWRGMHCIHSLASSVSGHYYDGFSVPRWLRPLTFYRLNNIMPVIECIFPHDDACMAKSLTKRDRRLLFKDAYNDACEQFYPDLDPDAWAHAIKRGVHVGSRYFGQC